MTRSVTPEEFAAWLEDKPVRRAHVSIRRSGVAEIEAYLPSNYQVTDTSHQADGYVTISGTDIAGWTLDGYVIPRLASGLITAWEAWVEE